ncbi:MAG: chorismate synthase, partial [Deltaproteobacteria bacterium]|nr:chorismate synthase [Deltaproteobacteria bacterium]
MGSSFGRNLKIATFGESHGPAMGVVVDGLPAGLRLSAEDIQKDLDRRRPGQSAFVSPRQEPDQAEILSGLADGFTNGAPLAILIRNQGARSKDYDSLARSFRPGHADWTYFQKYGLPPQPGGGRSSGRETVSRVAAGAAARALLALAGVSVQAASFSIGPIKAQKKDWVFSETNPLRFLDPDLCPLAEKEVEKAIAEGDSLGSSVELLAEGLPVGLGDPVFDKLEARLGQAFFSIGAVKAVEFGEALAASVSRGSLTNGALGPDGPLDNSSGAALGGISTGRPLTVRLYVKPTPSIAREQKTVDLTGQPMTLTVKGRHDPC